jgi:hypothetical protein
MRERERERERGRGRKAVHEDRSCATSSLSGYAHHNDSKHRDSGSKQRERAKEGSGVKGRRWKAPVTPQASMKSRHPLEDGRVTSHDGSNREFCHVIRAKDPIRSVKTPSEMGFGIVKGASARLARFVDAWPS